MELKPRSLFCSSKRERRPTVSFSSILFPGIRTICYSQGIQAGGIFIDQAAEGYLRRLLTQARVREDDLKYYVARGVEEFEIGLKRNFDGEGASPNYITIADRYNNPFIGVRRGIMSLDG
jgi:hypothetical protein